MEKHKGNLSAVIREVIDLAEAAFQDPDSVKKLISGLKKEQNLTSSTILWTLRNLSGRLPDNETINNIMGSDIFSLSDIEQRLNELGSEIYWNSSIKVSTDNNFQPTNAIFSITGKNHDINNFLASIISSYVAKKFNLGVSKNRSIEESFELHLVKGDPEWALRSVRENFGYLEDTLSELYRKSDFWNILISIYIKMNYEMTVIPAPFFEDILAGNTTHKITTVMERFCGRPIKEIPHEEFLKNLKLLYQTMGLFEDIDMTRDSLIIRHGLTDRTSIKKLSNMIVELLNLNGLTYNPTIGDNLIVLRQSPEMGKILMRMVEDIKTKEERDSNYHSDLLKMLEMQKNVPSNEDFLRSLSSKFGSKIIKNYEIEKKISIWNGNTFINYMDDMRSLLEQESRWSLISENVLSGKIMKCPMVKHDSKFDAVKCIFIKGLIEEWVSHAFGDQVEKVYKTPEPDASEKDFCDIYVALRS
ncbi:MAG: hypothetical protein J5U16_00030 [Candidatus Methanoperedens sp.]|nr:hypothetical protein [Candidatus Methanoperedens sp.]